MKMLLTKMKFTDGFRFRLNKCFTFCNLHYLNNYCYNTQRCYGERQMYHFTSIIQNVITSKTVGCSQLRNNVKRYNIHVQQNGVSTKAFKQSILQNTPILAGLSIQHKNSAKQFSTASNTVPDIPDIMVPQCTGIWKIFSESKPVEYIQECLMTIHSSTGLPWWAVIIMSTIAIRSAVTLPLAIYQQRNAAKLYNLKYEMNEIVKDLKQEANFAVSQMGQNEKIARIIYNQNLKEEWSKLIIRDNCHPFKNVILLVGQIPLWITISCALRNMCYLLPQYNLSTYITYQELSTEGFGWVSNLTQTDPFLILPLMLAILNFINIEINYSFQREEPKRLQRIVHYVLRGFALAMIPIGAYIPSCICLYWVISSGHGFAQHLLLLSPKFRRLTRIPECDKDHDKPYTFMYENIRNKFLKDPTTLRKS